jgi:hypothetical protein
MRRRPIRIINFVVVVISVIGVIFGSIDSAFVAAANVCDLRIKSTAPVFIQDALLFGGTGGGR